MLDVGKMVDAVLDAVDTPLRAFAERIKALEARAPERAEIPLAPDDVADLVVSTIAMLAEPPPPPVHRDHALAAIAPVLRPRSFTFEHDENGKVVAAHERSD